MPRLKKTKSPLSNSSSRKRKGSLHKTASGLDTAAAAQTIGEAIRQSMRRMGIHATSNPTPHRPMVERERNHAPGGAADEASPPSLREALLRDCIKATMSDRNKTYGDPLPQFELASRMKELFWTAFLQSLRHSLGSARLDVLGPDSPHAESINLLITKLARIACGPVSAPHRDSYLDIANYAVIAYEVAMRTEVAGKAS